MEQDLYVRRSIPAHAGKPARPSDARSRWKVYPAHAGNPYRGLIALSNYGSIPAHAGKPINSRMGGPTTKVYPRSCGETVCAALRTTPATGLSPLMRGNLYWRIPDKGAAGSIPAHAGKPTAPARSSEPGRVYPRSCGETSSYPWWRSSRTGLSPLMRGNRSRLSR